MGIIDLFSKRQKRIRGEVPDVYTYNELPQQLRVQIVHIIRDAFGIDHYAQNNAKEAYKFVKDALCREYGLFELVRHANADADSVLNFFLIEESTERALDVVELCFHVINVYIRGNQNFKIYTDRKIEPEAAVTELNARFKEHGIGYQFESKELIRVDSEYLHAEAVKPTLEVLRGAGFKGANEEFLLAHENYRHGKHKECLVDALKAFESTIKAICTIRGWSFKSSDPAKALITICFNKELLPSYLESQFSSLRSLLESGVPTIRNKNGGHGQGSEPVSVPEYFARYALNLTATSILFLVEAHQSKK